MPFSQAEGKQAYVLLSRPASQACFSVRRTHPILGVGAASHAVVSLIQVLYLSSGAPSLCFLNPCHPTNPLHRQRAGSVQPALYQSHGSLCPFSIHSSSTMCTLMSAA
jgi:hypothetical protein